jgi:preprotein translocase subunit SecY
MLRTVVTVLKNILGIPELRKRLIFTIVMLGVYRIGFHIYLPGVNVDALKSLMDSARQSGGGLLDFVQMTSALTGGDLQNATVFSLGIMPYISASIIFSLLVKVFPRLEQLQKEGEAGRKAINRYTRYATVALCIVQGIFIISFLTSTTGGRVPIADRNLYMNFLQLTVLTGGALFLMWLGEKITEYGIGNGISLLIMAGIIASMPAALLSLFKGFGSLAPEEQPFFVLRMLLLTVLFFGIVAAVVFITKGQRRIPIQQARVTRGRRTLGGSKHYMPIKVNSAGVLPIIFAQSLLILPTGILSFVIGSDNRWLALLSPDSFWYMVLYVWTSLYFNPTEIANNMKEYGSFIPGIRPGRRTAEYLQQVIHRITLAGAVFLAFIALTPQVVSRTLEVDYFISSFLGGTGILIVVGVALDLVDKIESQLLVRHYEGFVRSPPHEKAGSSAP